jgi:hypothetical protein
MQQDRFFGVTLTDNWVESNGYYMTGESHKDIANKLPLKSNRVLNERYNEIEKTGKYYRISEMKKGGKSFIFEITN